MRPDLRTSQAGKQGFTMIELMTAILIIAVLVAMVSFFYVSAANWAQQTANKQVLTQLNTALESYRTLGGMSMAHSLNGTNSPAKVQAVVAALRTGFTAGNTIRSFIQPGTTLNSNYLYAQGQGRNFTFAGYGASPNLVGTGGDGLVGMIEYALKSQGTAPSDDVAFHTWLATAQAATNNTTNYWVLSNPTNVIDMILHGTGKLEVNRGDGATSEYTLSTNDQTITHNYAATGNYGITMIGNVTYIESNLEAGANATSFGGNISTMTGLTSLYIAGSNTVSGDITNLPLIYIFMTGNNTLSGSINNMPNLNTLAIMGNNTITGNVTGRSALGFIQVQGNSNITGDITGMTQLYYLSAGANGSITGNISNMTSLTMLSCAGNNSFSGKIDNLTLLDSIQLYNSAPIDISTATWANYKALCLVVLQNLSQSQVDSILAALWTNKDQAKTRSQRSITLTTGCAAPSSTGNNYKTQLQAYRTPNNNASYALWTINTN